MPQLCHEHIKVENHWFSSSGCFICVGMYWWQNFQNGATWGAEEGLW